MLSKCHIFFLSFFYTTAEYSLDVTCWMLCNDASWSSSRINKCIWIVLNWQFVKLLNRNITYRLHFGRVCHQIVQRFQIHLTTMPECAALGGAQFTVLWHWRLHNLKSCHSNYRSDAFIHFSCLVTACPLPWPLYPWQADGCFCGFLVSNPTFKLPHMHFWADTTLFSPLSIHSCSRVLNMINTLPGIHTLGSKCI